MNIGLKNFLMFALGAGCGAFVAYQLLNEKYAALALEEIESVREVFGRGEPKNSIDEEMAPIDEETEPFDEDREPDSDKPYMPNMEEKRHYNKVVKKYTQYNQVENVDTISAEPENSFLIPNSYVISLDAYTNDCLEHDKLSFSYYEKDDTLADEQDEIVPAVEDVVGEALLCFGDQSDDPDVVYVRNESLSIDYEIIRLHRSYQETVLGIKTNVGRDATTKTTRRRLNEDNG